MHVIPSAPIWASLHPPPDPVESSIDLAMRGGSTTRCITAIADAQGGNVARTQLQRLGVAKGMVDRLVAKGWLIVVHLGVYAVGHRPRTHRERWWAAVLACGRAAKCSAGTSAAAHGLIDPHVRVHIIAPVKRSRPGIANHTGHTETVWIDGLPCTTVARALLDMAGCVPERLLERACRQAQVRGVLDLEELGRLMLDCPRARGVRRLRRILGNPVLLAPTRSRPERIALQALLDDGWPWPDVGKTVHGEEVDFSYPDLRVALEIDGATHDTQVQQALDAARDAKLAALGWRVVRVRDTDAAQAPAALRRVVDPPRIAGSIDDSTEPRSERDAA